MKIPLSKPYVDQEIKDKVLEVIDSGNYILGSQSKHFEKEFAQSGIECGAPLSICWQ